MLEVLKHRGPDSTGMFLDSQVGLGIDRLSIIDLKKGDQPIHNEDESVWVTFNGEIYNYIELREELERAGHRFYTDSDTETVVHSYEQWGYDCLAHFRGMFGLAIWDSNRRILFAARDRFGKKPLYYAVVGGALLFASELKSILEYEALVRRIDYTAMDHFMTYGYVPSPMSIFKGVSKLPPGSYLTYDGADMTVARYWDMKFEPRETSEGEAIERLFARISDSVSIRLRSEVPLGAYLSGGIDSSLVASMMSRVTDHPVKTVTIGFEEEDEHVTHGRMVAEYLETDHEEYYVEPSSIEILPRLIWHCDEPFADSSIIPTFHLAEMMRKQVTVALTGDGGDEMFMGYPFLKDEQVFEFYRALPTAMRRLGLKMLLRWPGNAEVRKLANHALEKDYGDQDFFGRYALRMVVFVPKVLRSAYSQGRLESSGVAPTLAYVENLARGCTSSDPLDAVDYATFKGYLSEMILTKVDRMSMAVSLEPRCPFLDHTLAEYVGTIPSGLKWGDGAGKYILKKMAMSKALLPKEVVYQKKVGFGVPVDRWMSGEWAELSDQVMEKAVKTGLFERTYLSSLLENRFLNASKIFNVAMFTLWHALFIENDVSGPLSLNKLI